MSLLERLFVSVLLLGGVAPAAAEGPFPYYCELPANVTVSIAQKGPISGSIITVEMSLSSKASRSIKVCYGALPWGGGESGPFYFVVLLNGEGRREPKYTSEWYGPDLTLKPGGRISRVVSFDFPALKGHDARKDFIELIWVERRRSGVGQSGVVQFK